MSRQMGRPGGRVQHALAALAGTAMVAAGLVAITASPAAATVSDEAGFRLAWTTAGTTTIDLSADIILKCTDGAGNGVSVRNSTTPIVVDGHGFSLTQTCTTGTNNGVLHQAGTGALTLQNLTITGGNTSGSGGGVFANGHVAVTNSTITANHAGAAGLNIGGGVAGGSVTVTNSTISNNTAAGGAGGVFAGGSVTVTNSTISGNTAGAGGGGGVDGGSVTVTNSTISGNTATTGSSGGVSSIGAVTATNSTFSNNTASIFGGGIGSDVVTVLNSTFDHNSAHNGGGIGVLGLIGSPVLKVTNSTLTKNDASRGDGGAIDAGIGSATVTNTTITDNTAGREGGIDTGALTLVYSTVVGNTAFSEGANIEAEPAASTVSFGSVVAHPLGGAVNCQVPNMTSKGFNWDTDGSCGFGAGPGDHSNGPAPQLGSLASNGGPTQTLLPQTGSPLIDAIPLASCRADGASGITTDQRSLARPSGPGCDIGAVEVQIAVPAPVVITPKFTG